MQSDRAICPAQAAQFVPLLKDLSKFTTLEDIQKLSQALNLKRSETSWTFPADYLPNGDSASLSRVVLQRNALKHHQPAHILLYLEQEFGNDRGPKEGISTVYGWRNLTIFAAIKQSIIHIGDRAKEIEPMQNLA